MVVVGLDFVVLVLAVEVLAILVGLLVVRSVVNLAEVGRLVDCVMVGLLVAGSVLRRVGVVLRGDLVRVCPPVVEVDNVVIALLQRCRTGS